MQLLPADTEARKKLEIKPGDTVRVWQIIKEGDKTRRQAFEGLIIARKHGTEPGATFIVRRATGSVSVEMIFPLYSPNIDKIELVSRSKVRRAKLYYLRERTAKAIRRKTKKLKQVNQVNTGKIGSGEKMQETEN